MKFQEWKLIISTVLFLMSLFVSNIEWLFYSLIMISYLIVGYEVIIDSIKNILKREFFDENFLMVLATVGAIFIGEYHEALLVMLLFQIGEYLQEKAIAKSRRSISDLMELKSDTAMIQKDGKESIVPLKDVQLGDIMIVKPGENIPLDGKIIEGHSNIDMRALTGETIPVTVKPGDSILSGSINESGLLTVMVEKTEQESTVTKILELIEHASDKKTKTEKFMTKFSKIYTPTIVIFAFLIALIPSIITKDTSTWVYRSIIFLVLSCPCALVISIPLGFFSGIGACSKIGMLVKGSNELEKLSKIRSIAFDKTGTLTEGVFEVTKIETEMDVDQFLSYVIALEQYSNHPIAQSILKLKTNSSKVDVENIQEQPGKGIIGIVDNQHIMIGNDQLCAQEKIVVPTVETIGTILYVILEKKYIGHVIISDKIKEHAKETIETLRNQNITYMGMISGDRKEIVIKVSEALQLDEGYAELLPNDKVQIVENLMKEKKGPLAFVGDGMNDAPILARSDLGISMGKIGSAAAIEASDIVIMNDDISVIPRAIMIARKSLQMIKWNIIMAIGVKMLVLVLGIFGISSIWFAIFADVGVTILAIINCTFLSILKK